MCFVLFVCCPTCVLILAAQGRLGMKVVCVCVRNSIRKEFIEQWSQGSGSAISSPNSALLTSSVSETRRGMLYMYVRVYTHTFY